MATLEEYKVLSEQVVDRNIIACMICQNLFLFCTEELIKVLTIWLDSGLTGKALEEKFNLFNDGELSSENITDFAKSFL